MKVSTKTTIEITMDDMVFQFTKEEAIALRDALNEQIGEPNEIPYKPIPLYPFDNIPKQPVKWIPQNPYPPFNPSEPKWLPDIWCEAPSSTCNNENFYGGIGRSSD